MIYNTLEDRKYPDSFKENYHCHILCRSGEMQFDAVGKTFAAGSVVIWQMTTAISNVRYSADFDADFVLISNPFLNLYNPEQVWATKGYVYIKNNPVFHLESDEWDVIEADFNQFRRRIHSRFELFHDDKVGRVFQLLLMDMWSIYSREMENADTDETSASLFMRYLTMLRQNCREQREVAWYAGELCVTPKYLSAVCQKMTGKGAAYWIEYYTLHEILLLLNNPALPDAFPGAADAYALSQAHHRPYAFGVSFREGLVPKFVVFHPGLNLLVIHGEVALLLSLSRYRHSRLSYRFFRMWFEAGILINRQKQCSCFKTSKIPVYRYNNVPAGLRS